ncbi:MAG: B12-binding domain-containing radical SAM protein [Deltaproteobacteria bacterium]
MRVVLVDLNSSFYDRHWAYALTATLRRRGVKDVHYLELAPKPRSVKALAALKPGLVLYSAFSYSVPDVIAFDACLKSAHACTSVLGGPGPTFGEIDIARTTLDALCFGEGETALGDYLDSGLRSGRNIVTKEDPVVTPAPLIDLAAEPMPDRSIVYGADRLLARTPNKAFMTGRGCPYSCTYCFNHAFNGMFGLKLRKRSVDQVIEEICCVRDRYRLDFVSFQDDTFCIDKTWLVDFAEKYPRRVGLPFACNVRPNLVDEDVVRMLKTAGVRALSWSVESGNDTVRNEVLRRGVSKEQMDRAASLFRRYRIPYRLANVIGIPGETAEQVAETVDYNVRLGSAFATANIFTPYPRLELTQYAVRHGYLDPARLERLPRNFFVGSVLNVSRRFDAYLVKTYCLLPFFVWFPVLWRRPGVRRFLYALPRVLLRPVYEMAYLFACKVIYGLRTSPAVALAMAWRYIKSLV